jgi:deoxyribodipyrimidine photo-lyase
MVNWAANTNALSELIYGILCKFCLTFPEVTNNFKPAYDGIQWLNNEDDFKLVFRTTGYQWWTLNASA